MANNREKYICLSAMLRAREPKMLSFEIAERMIKAGSFSDAAKILTDCGYDDLSGAKTGEINQYLEKREGEIIAELSRLCPDPEVIGLFQLKYDYHNAKVVLKSEAMGNDAGELFLAGGRIAPDKLVTFYREDQLIQLPLDLSSAMREAKDVLNRTGNPQAADFILDEAYFKEASRLAKIIDSPWVTEYVKLLIDSANLRSAVRTFKLGKDENFLGEVIMDGGSVSKQMILTSSDRESVLELFANGKLSLAVDFAGQALSGSMTAFEKAIDNAVMAYIKTSGLINYGPEVIISYLGAIEVEITAVRMILTCTLSKVPGEKILERLRDFYA